MHSQKHPFALQNVQHYFKVNTGWASSFSLSISKASCCLGPHLQRSKTNLAMLEYLNNKFLVAIHQPTKMTNFVCIMERFPFPNCNKFLTIRMNSAILDYMPQELDFLLCAKMHFSFLMSSLDIEHLSKMFVMLFKGLSIDQDVVQIDNTLAQQRLQDVIHKSTKYGKGLRKAKWHYKKFESYLVIDNHFLLISNGNPYLILSLWL